MDKFKRINFDATSIEYSFARIFGHRLGQRGESNDADVFRSGNISDLGDNLINFCDHLEARLKQHYFHPDEGLAGGAKARLDVALEELREVAKEMQKSSEKEPQDYHWLIIGSMVSIISSLLDHIEGSGHSLG